MQTKQSLLQADAAEKNTQIASLAASLSEILERQNILKEDRTAAEARRADIDARQAECRKRLTQAQEDVTSANNTISGYELRLKTRQDKRARAAKAGGHGGRPAPDHRGADEDAARDGAGI